MEKKSEGKLIFIFLVSIILLAVLVSASIFDWLKNPRITGKATNLPTNVSVSIVGINAVVIVVWNSTLTGTLVNPSEGNPKIIFFNVTVSDADGLNDINDSSVIAFLNRTTPAETQTRTNTTACSANSGETTTTSKNYTCAVTMWYWDENGTWAINVTANDMGNKTYNQSVNTTFAYGELKAVVIGPSMINFPSAAPGNTNVKSSDNTTINNTGNVVIISPNIKVNAIDLGGITDNTKRLNASNFTASWNYSSSGELAQCNNASTGSAVALINTTDVGITTANLTRGNVTALEILYYCIPQVPIIPSQTYVANASRSWTIKVA